MKHLLQRKWVLGSAALLLVSGAGLGFMAVIHHLPSDATASAINVRDQLAPELLQVTAFRSPTCGCCSAWIEHMKTAGFQVTDNVTDDIEGVKREHNVPHDLAACHTALVGGYVVEGHIPAADIQRLLTEKPEVAGIAVPGMPLGSPGMESGNIKEPYAVYSFDASGDTQIFAEHS